MSLTFSDISEQHSPEPEQEAERCAQYAQDVDEALTRFHNRTRWEASTEETPVDSILSAELPRLDKFTDIQLRERLAAAGVDLESEPSRADCIRILRAFDEVERGVQRETVTRLFQYFCADG